MLCYTTQRQLPCTYLTPRCSLYFEMLTTEERKVSHKRPCLFSRYQNICGMVKLTDNNKVAIRRASAGHALQSQSRIVHKLTPSGKTRQFCKKDQTQRNPGSRVSIFHGPRVRISLFRQKIISKANASAVPHKNRMTLAEGSRLEISTRAVCFTEAGRSPCRVLTHPRGFGREI